MSIDEKNAYDVAACTVQSVRCFERDLAFPRVPRDHAGRRCGMPMNQIAAKSAQLFDSRQARLIAG